MPLPSPSDNKNGSQKPKLMPKLKLKLKQKVKSSAQDLARSQTQNPAYTGMRNYFEEVVINREMRIVDMHNLTNDFVCLYSAALYFPLH